MMNSIEDIFAQTSAVADAVASRAPYVVASAMAKAVSSIRVHQNAPTPEAVMQELQRRKQQTRAAIQQALADKAERDKQHIREVMSEEAILGLTYVPFVIAEIAWDYADTILDLAVILKLSETRKLCRAIKELRREYDRKRFDIINADMRKNETENMIMFQECLSDFFGKAYATYKDAIFQKRTDLAADMVMIIAAAYLCRMVIRGLKRYAEAQEKVVAAVLGYEINPILPKELDKLYALVIEFAGDCRLPDSIVQTEKQYAEELAKYIADTGFTGGKEKKKSTPKQQINMTNDELFNKIQSVMTEFSADLDKNIHKGSKAAGVRARKASLELEKLMKQYRKQSVK